MSEAYHELPLRDLLRRVSENPPDTPDWIKARTEIDRRSAASNASTHSLRESDFVESLSSVTRAERRLLLVVSTVIIVIVQAGLVPTRIEALGVSLSAGEQASLLVVAAGINLYLLIGFLVYAAADGRAWREDQKMLATQKARSILDKTSQRDEAKDATPDQLRIIGEVTEDALLGSWPHMRRTYSVKRWFDAWAPIPVALYAIGLVIFRLAV